jgi:hypothetical protein
VPPWAGFNDPTLFVAESKVSSMVQRTQVFVSYSRRDAEWLERLKVHLRPFERAGRIDCWDDY